MTYKEKKEVLLHHLRHYEKSKRIKIRKFFTSMRERVENNKYLSDRMIEIIIDFLVHDVTNTRSELRVILKDFRSPPPDDDYQPSSLEHYFS